MRFTVTTANTQFDKLFYSDGLQQLAESDILLLQEVSNPIRHHVADTLKSNGFRLLYLEARYGLLIALKESCPLSMIDGFKYGRRIASFNLLEKLLISLAAPGRREFKERGLIAVKLETQSGFKFTVTTTHPAFDLTPADRARQIDNIGRELKDPYFAGPMILGADMNHHPAPKQVDKEMWNITGLSRVALGNLPTWETKKSKLFVPAQILAFFNRKPPESHDGQLDDILYRGFFRYVSVSVLDIASDHNAVTATFEIDESNLP